MIFLRIKICISMWTVECIQGALKGCQERSMSFLLWLFQSKMEPLDSETLFQLRVGATAGFAPTAVTYRIFFVTPWKINVLNPKMEVWKMTFLVNWMIFSFHVHFQACSGFKGSWFPWGKVKQRSKEERTGSFFWVLIQLKLGVGSMKGAKNGAFLLVLHASWEGSSETANCLNLPKCLPRAMCGPQMRGPKAHQIWLSWPTIFTRYPWKNTTNFSKNIQNFWIISIVDQLGLQHIFQAQFCWLMVLQQIFAPPKKRSPFRNA